MNAYMLVSCPEIGLHLKVNKKSGRVKGFFLIND